MINRSNNEKGAALIITLSLLLLISLLGLSAFNGSMSELQIATNDAAWIEAQYLAESGIALLLKWFQEPETFPEIGTFSNALPPGGQSSFLKKRQTDSRGARSFFNDQGKSQFTGTAEEPGFEYQYGPDSGDLFGQVLAEFGTLTRLKLFGPITPGAICTVEATGTTLSGISRTVTAQMVSSPLPSFTAAVQAGEGGSNGVPILVHWGDVRVMGDANLGDSLKSIPAKDPVAMVEGQPYTSFDRRDAWIDFYVGDAIIGPQPTACPDCSEPFWYDGYENIHQFQGQIQNDFRLDSWDYEQLKALAINRGTYYATDQEGFLYLDGVMNIAYRMTPSEALSSKGVGDYRGFVFIDTVDGNPPDGTNMATLDLPVDYLEGLFFIQAHVVLQESGLGQSIQVRSPPSEGTADPFTRETVTLSRIHLNGILSIAGRLTVKGRPMVFGTVLAQQGFVDPGQLEVWYDADLSTGYYSGLPAVTILKGSWSIR